MSSRIEKLKERAQEASKCRNELKEQKEININNLSITKRLFSIPLKDGFSLSQIDNLSKIINSEKKWIDKDIEKNKDVINEALQESDSFIRDLAVNKSKLEQIKNTSDLVDVGQQINNTEKRIGKLEVIKRMLEDETTNNSQDNNFLSYLPINAERTEQYTRLTEQYGMETDLNIKEKIRAISELFVLENDLNLTDGDPNIPQLGGLYGDITKGDKTKLKGYHAHHIPPKSVSDNIGENKKGDALPAIYLTDEDHKLTASYGGRMRAKLQQSNLELNNKNNLRSYKERLIEQINNGNYADAFRNEVYEIKYLFGDKYDGAIKKAIEANRNYLQEFGNPKVNSENK